jgi:membrane protein YqaA with SNARE-associated domain
MIERIKIKEQKEIENCESLMRQSTTKLYNWAIQKANSDRAPLWIALLFSLELFLFVPLDAILMFFCLQNRKNIFLYIGIGAIASTLSGLVGYLLGHFLWDLIGSYIVPHLISLSYFNKLSLHFQNYEVWAVFFGSLLPFPLKALSLSAGVFHLGILPFITYMALARLLRFSLVGAAMALWGESVKGFVDRHFHRIVMLVGAKIAMAFLFFWAIGQ